MDWYIRNAVAGRLKLFGEGALTGTAGTGEVERSIYGFSGAPAMDMSPLYDLERRCEWYVGEGFHVLGRQRANSDSVVRAPEDARWSAEADACVWVSEGKQFVFEIKSGRSYAAALHDAAALTLRNCKMLLTFKSQLDSQVWAQRTAENFAAFMSGTPIYLSVSDIAVINDCLS